MTNEENIIRLSYEDAKLRVRELASEIEELNNELNYVIGYTLLIKMVDIFLKNETSETHLRTTE